MWERGRCRQNGSADTHPPERTRFEQMEITAIRGTLEGLQAACREMDRGLAQVLERRSGPQQDDLVELVYALREMHRNAAHLLSRYGGGAHPLLDPDAQKRRASPRPAR